MTPVGPGGPVTIPGRTEEDATRCRARPGCGCLSGPRTPEAAQTIVEATIVERRATVEEIANDYAVLASDEAGFVTGVVWVVDGGVGISRGLPGRKAHEAGPPLALPVRHNLEGFAHAPDERPGECGDQEPAG